MNTQNNKTSLVQFIPLLTILALVCGATFAKSYYTGSYAHLMTDFMGFFFLIFGAFKLINLKGFVSAYRMYDLIASRSDLYATIYPFIELGLGLAYLMRWNLVVINSITALVMAISSLGVLNALFKKEKILCACLGAVFKIPMTYVTAAEDLLMLAMALYMLFV